jgi:rhodanese-related sulfurtransferase
MPRGARLMARRAAVQTAGVSAIDRLLADARAQLVRLDPQQAAERARHGALLIDTRPVEQRRRDGEIPGAIVVERNVLEWRLDPTSPDRIAEITDHQQTLIVVCHDGYSSSLAAATLRQLGLVNATDLDGGFQAWAAAGLPVRRADVSSG